LSDELSSLPHRLVRPSEHAQESIPAAGATSSPDLGPKARLNQTIRLRAPHLVLHPW